MPGTPTGNEGRENEATAGSGLTARPTDYITCEVEVLKV